MYLYKKIDMKKILLLLTFVLLGCTLNAQEPARLFKQINVPTDIQRKSMLLEEFTGIYCGHCPDGHTIARNLMYANENAYVIAIHSGYFAVPNSGDPDFRIPEGEIIDNELKVNTLFGYPSAAINRHLFNGEYVTYRSDWIKNAKAIHAEDAPVNILATAVFDGNPRKLSVKVEGYYTMEIPETSHWLNIAVLEDNIIGPQSGIGGGYHYVHNHMLRGFITPMSENVWGDEIVAPAQGNFFDFEYEYDLPAHINNVPIVPENIEIIAFVCAGKMEVLNVTGGKPSYINYEKPLNATLLTPAREIGARYGFNFFEAQLRNLSHQTITSATFEVTINGEIREVEWTGEIPAFQTKPITITVEPYIINVSNPYSIKLIALNSENLNGNTISGSFNAPIETTGKIFIEIKTDLRADENRFLIRDRNGSIVQEFGPYLPNLVAIYNETTTLNKNETYCFEVIDEWWDGIQSPRGYFKLHNENGDLIIQAFDIKLFGERVFIHTSKEVSITTYNSINQELSLFYDNLQQTIEISFKPVATGMANLSLYAITGTLLLQKIVTVEEGRKYELSLPASQYGKGIYLLKINQENKNATQKFVIY